MADATIRERAYTGPAETFGYLETRGNQIVDAATGDAVRLIGANWHGAESATKVPGGLWARNWQDMMDEMAEEGLNTLRIPISPAILDGKPVTKDGIRFDINPDLKGLDGLDVLDKIVGYAGELGIRIVIDMHRITPGVGKEETGLWFNDTYSEDDLARDWKKIAKHYADDPTVIGFDLFNEPSGRGWDKAHWSEGGPKTSDWHRAAERLGNEIHEVNPDALIFVEGVHIVDGDWYWVGGNLKGARQDPIDLELDDRLVYSPHDYPWSVQNVPWLEGATALDIRENFDEHWGYLYKDGTAPVVIGETGGRLKSAADRLYFETLVDYFEANRSNPDGGMGLLWWTWGVNSGDTAGLLDDWYTINEDRLSYLKRLAGDMLPVDGEAAARVESRTMTFTFVQTNNSDKERVFSYETRSGSATEGKDFVGETGFIRLDKGQTRAEIDIAILNDADFSEGDESFFIDVSYLGGKVFQTFEGVIEEGGPGGGVDTFTPEPVVVEPPIKMPGKLESPDGSRVYNLRDSQVTLEAEAQDDGGMSFVGTFKVWGGKSLGETLGDWKLRLEGLENLMHKASADEVFRVSARGDDALIFDPRDGRIAGLKEVDFSFELDVAKMSVDWRAVAGTTASGEALAGAKASGSGGLAVSFEIEDIWKSGEMRGSVTVTNVSGARIDDWSLEIAGEGFDFVADRIHNVYATTADGGDAIVVNPRGWQDDLKAGESYKFGFNGIVDPGSMGTVASDAFVQTILDTLSFELI